MAFAAIVGSFKHPGANNYTEHYVGLVYADRSGKMQTAHAFPPPDSVTIERGSEGFDGVPSNFTWRAKGVGRLHVGKDEGMLDIDLPAVRATAHFHDRVPWNAERPDTDGPEVGTGGGQWERGGQEEKKKGRKGEGRGSVLSSFACCVHS